jgi:hypothetical protein
MALKDVKLSFRIGFFSFHIFGFLWAVTCGYFFFILALRFNGDFTDDEYVSEIL